jgi:hypothetical protein
MPSSFYCYFLFCEGPNLSTHSDTLNLSDNDIKGSLLAIFILLSDTISIILGRCGTYTIRYTIPPYQISLALTQCFVVSK